MSEDLEQDNLALLDDEQIRTYAEMAQAEIKRLRSELAAIGWAFTSSADDLRQRARLASPGPPLSRSANPTKPP